MASTTKTRKSSTGAPGASALAVGARTAGAGAKKATAKKAAAKKATAKKPAAKKAAAKKTTAKKPTAKKPTAKKAAAKKTTAKATKAAPKKTTAAKKPAAKKTAAATKTAAKKTTAVQKRTARKPPATQARPARRTASAPPKTGAPTTVTDTTTTTGTLAVKPGEDPWTAEEIAEVRGELSADRTRLREEIGIAERGLADLLSGGVDGAGNDQADVGSTSLERDAEMSLAANHRELLVQVDKALSRIDAGTYGNCENCGQPIGKLRLLAFPRATLCMTCKQREERR